MAIFEPLGIGRNALLVQERALGVTGHNIANVNTPGYSRQRVDLAAVRPAGTGAGRGVEIAQIRRIVDPFLEARTRSSASNLAGATTDRELLDRVQALFPVRDDALGGALQQFFSAAGDVANAPQDLAARGVLLAKGEALAYQVRATADGINGLQREIDDRILQAVRDANGAIATVAQLNRDIVAYEITGNEASDLRDQRTQALQTLAGSLGINVVEDANGAVNVFATNGVPLVLGAEGATLAGAPDGTTTGLDGGALSKVGVQTDAGAFLPVGGTPGGTIGSLLALRDQVLPTTATDLDRLATTLRDAVNAVQADAGGRDLDGLQGTDFFAGTGAADFRVALTDARGIAAARSNNPGDNANALLLANVGTTAQATLGGSTLGDFFGSMQAAVGERARQAEDLATIQENVNATLSAQREAVSGVSLEEEFTDLIRFQRGFQAAARLISVGDRMLDDLLGLVR